MNMTNSENLLLELSQHFADAGLRQPSSMQEARVILQERGVYMCLREVDGLRRNAEYAIMDSIDELNGV